MPGHKVVHRIVHEIVHRIVHTVPLRRPCRTSTTSARNRRSGHRSLKIACGQASPSSYAMWSVSSLGGSHTTLIPDCDAPLLEYDAFYEGEQHGHLHRIPPTCQRAVGLPCLKVIIYAGSSGVATAQAAKNLTNLAVQDLALPVHIFERVHLPA